MENDVIDEMFEIPLPKLLGWWDDKITKEDKENYYLIRSLHEKQIYSISSIPMCRSDSCNYSDSGQ